ncbi:hypothetical protein BDR03DRAFT_987669 [Suillus americanus]|nr:hypothetical protein BDR03DRAFT_987669 [Suillus americanus]
MQFFSRDRTLVPVRLHLASGNGGVEKWYKYSRVTSTLQDLVGGLILQQVSVKSKTSKSFKKLQDFAVRIPVREQQDEEAHRVGDEGMHGGYTRPGNSMRDQGVAREACDAEERMDTGSLQRRVMGLEELRNLIAQTLREGKCIVIWGVDKPQQAKLDVDYLEDHGFLQFMRVSMIHDIKEWTRDFTYPQVEGTIEEFIHNLDDPNKIQVILDPPSTGAGIPEHLRPSRRFSREWVGFGTSPGRSDEFYHDSYGGVTFVQSVLGKKMCTPAFPKNAKISRTKFLEHALELTNTPINSNKINANWHIEVVTLGEGNMLIQLPGQYHAAFTHTAASAKGAHCFNYEFLHQMELSRHLDGRNGKYVTNQHHGHSLDTLHQMVLYLPRASSHTRK